MGRQLRPYQREACDAVHAEWASGIARTAIVLPTGAGKTDCIAHLAVTEAAAGGRVLILAHRSELLDQIGERCLMHAPDIPVGRVQADRNQHRRRIVVATVQTLAGARRRSRMLPPTLVIVDEAHHVASPSYVAVLRWAGCFDGTARMFGVTATPSRSDKRGLGDVIETIAFARDIAWGIEQGWLVRPRGRVVVGEHLDLNKAKVSRGDYQDGELGELVSQDVDQIVKAWLEHADDRPTVAFCPTVASAQAMAAEFRAQGVPTGEVYGGTTPAERARVFGGITDGSLRVLVNVMVATEGLDLPVLSCALMARPTKVPSLYQQMVGRVLRPYDGKVDALVLDVVGASHTQRLQTLIDLSPSAEVNTDELDLIPCERCGGYVTRKPAAIAAAEAQGMEACSCPCDGCGFLVAECACAAGRDPDGGRRRLLGPAKYAEVDLLGLAESKLRWLATRKGVPFSIVGDRIVVLWPDSGNTGQGPDGTYSVGHIDARGRDGRWVDGDVPHPLDEAKELATTWALTYRPDVLDEQGAPWRTARRKATDKQVLRAQRMGIVDAQRYTVGGISDAMDVVAASRVIDR